jgi:hypothetical protein
VGSAFERRKRIGPGNVGCLFCCLVFSFLFLLLESERGGRERCAVSRQKELSDADGSKKKRVCVCACVKDLEEPRRCCQLDDLLYSSPRPRSSRILFAFLPWYLSSNTPTTLARTALLLVCRFHSVRVCLVSISFPSQSHPPSLPYHAAPWFPGGVVVVAGENATPTSRICWTSLTSLTSLTSMNSGQSTPSFLLRSYIDQNKFGGARLRRLFREFPWGPFSPGRSGE